MKKKYWNLITALLVLFTLYTFLKTQKPESEPHKYVTKTPRSVDSVQSHMSFERKSKQLFPENHQTVQDDDDDDDGDNEDDYPERRKKENGMKESDGEKGTFIDHEEDTPEQIQDVFPDSYEQVFEENNNDDFDDEYEEEIELAKNHEKIKENYERKSERERKSYMKSQFGEDEYVFNRFFKNPLKTKGTFLEVGALDGVLYSNTYFFEKLLGWDGILIEPTPTRYKDLTIYRDATYKFEGAICEERKKITLISSGNDAVNGNLEHMSEEFVEKFHSKHGMKRLEFEVQCDTIAHYIGKTPVRHIDFLIIDVEGMELPALMGFDWSVTVDVLAIEISEPELTKNHVIKSLLTEKGFQYQTRLRLSEIWAHNRFLSKTSST